MSLQGANERAILHGCRIPKTSDNNLYIRPGTKSTTSLTEITIVMGIRGLPKELHESGGVAGVSCKEEGKSTHVDFLCRFFRLLQTRAFHILQQRVKTGSNSVTETPAPELQLEIEVTARSRKRKDIVEHNPSSSTPSLDVTIPFDAKRTLDELIEDSIDQLGYKKLFLNPDGLSPVDMKNQRTFRAIAFILDDIMSKAFDKKATVIRVDGSPSEQKRGEHRRRNKTLERSLNNLQTKVSGSTRSTKQLFRTCKTTIACPERVSTRISSQF
ncbi:hypothetical protein BGZ90_007861 [Linnemannia elongata]|nr:hypothetical protein BGZ90_007861 [Linnemannia elongata]